MGLHCSTCTCTADPSGLHVGQHLVHVIGSEFIEDRMLFRVTGFTPETIVGDMLTDDGKWRSWHIDREAREQYLQPLGPGDEQRWRYELPVEKRT